jgi:hypothetical protein
VIHFLAGVLMWIGGFLIGWCAHRAKVEIEQGR